MCFIPAHCGCEEIQEKTNGEMDDMASIFFNSVQTISSSKEKQEKKFLVVIIKKERKRKAYVLVHVLQM